MAAIENAKLSKSRSALVHRRRRNCNRISLESFLEAFQTTTARARPMFEAFQAADVHLRRDRREAFQKCTTTRAVSEGPDCRHAAIATTSIDGGRGAGMSAPAYACAANRRKARTLKSF